MQNIGEGRLEIPQQWHNQSINVFTAQPPGAPGMSVSVNRDRLAYGTTLQDYSVTQCKKLADQLKDLKFIEQSVVAIDGHQAYHHEFTWNSPDVGILHQMLLCVADGPVILNLTSSVLGRMSEDQVQTIKGVLHSFKFNTPANMAAEDAGLKKTQEPPALPS